MNESIMDDVTRRLNRLERENRWMKRTGGLLLIAITALVILGQAQCARQQSEPVKLTAKTVEAERFVLKDSDGKIRGLLGTALEAGNVSYPLLELPAPETSLSSYGVHLYSKDGRYIAGITERKSQVNSEGWLSLYDKNTPSSAHLIVGSGIASLSLAASEKNREVYEREEEDYARKWNAAESVEEKRKIDETTPYEGYTATLTAWSRGQRSSLVVGHRLTRLLDSGTVELNSGKGRPSVTLSDEEGRSRAVLGSTQLKILSTGSVEQPPVSSLVLFDENGRVAWRVPR